MKQFTNFVQAISRFLDGIAGICLVGIMLLTVGNIFLRLLWNKPILGAYEYVSTFTAVMIGLALAYCALQNGHIAVDIFVDRLPDRWQKLADGAMNVAALIFWGFACWHLGNYALSTLSSGVVAPTTQVSLFPFILLVAIGVSVLCLVLIYRTLKICKRVVADR